MTEDSHQLITVHGEILNPAHVRSIRVKSEARDGSPTAREHQVEACFGLRPNGERDVVYLTPPLRKGDADKVLAQAAAILYRF